jgi:hypothetical protein
MIRIILTTVATMKHTGGNVLGVEKALKNRIRLRMAMVSSKSGNLAYADPFFLKHLLLIDGCMEMFKPSADSIRICFLYQNR